MRDYTIKRFSLTDLRGPGSYRDALVLETKAETQATCEASSANEALARLLKEGDINSPVDLTVVDDPDGSDAAWVEYAGRLYVARPTDAIPK